MFTVYKNTIKTFFFYIKWSSLVRKPDRIHKMCPGLEWLVPFKMNHSKTRLVWYSDVQDKFVKLFSTCGNQEKFGIKYTDRMLGAQIQINISIDFHSSLAKTEFIKLLFRSWIRLLFSLSATKNIWISTLILMPWVEIHQL
jgi:hypothetical protein